MVSKMGEEDTIKSTSLLCLHTWWQNHSRNDSSLGNTLINPFGFHHSALGDTWKNSSTWKP